ncbi:MAG: xyloglucanase, partial [Bryobacteraceae bacterium]
SFTKVGTVDDAPLIGFGMSAPGASYPAVYVIGTVSGVYGIFRSDDAGASWTRINDDAHQYGFLGTITGDPRIYGRVYVGTQGRGIVYGDIAAGAPHSALRTPTLKSSEFMRELLVAP